MKGRCAGSMMCDVSGKQHLRVIAQYKGFSLLFIELKQSSYTRLPLPCFSISLCLPLFHLHPMAQRQPTAAAPALPAASTALHRRTDRVPDVQVPAQLFQPTLPSPSSLPSPASGLSLFSAPASAPAATAVTVGHPVAGFIPSGSHMAQLPLPLLT
uniref:Uncharacterized protein n=1 Tax=Opuntia streptacantha TaxID=393608 RepID=A0A7C8ZRX6_OPUST